MEKHYNIAYGVVRELIAKKKTDFIIFPYGMWGEMIHSILEKKFGVTPRAIIDNNICKYRSDVYSLAEINNLMSENTTVLLTSDHEGIYSEIRNELMQYVNLEQIVDVFSNSVYFPQNNYYSPISYQHPRLQALEMASREIYANNVHGSIAECGVYKGWFANYMSRFMPDRPFHLFDTFEGFDERDINLAENDYSGEFRKIHTFTDTSVELALNNIGYRNNTIVHKGYFPETAMGLEDEIFAFVSLDTDLYKPILAGLEFFWPRLAPGGYIFVDDLAHNGLHGVRDAVIDFSKKIGVGYVSIYDGTDATAVFAKTL